MRITSAEANKLLKKLEENKRKILTEESESKTFHCAISESPSILSPHYIFSETQQVIEIINNQIIKLKHAINYFNVNTVVCDNLTIDQILVKMPMLQKEREKLRVMAMTPSRKRCPINGSVIDYIYTNYDPDEVTDALAKVDDEITKLQLELDKVNTTVTFEVE